MVIEITTMIIVMPLQNNNINNNITVIALIKNPNNDRNGLKINLGALPRQPPTLLQSPILLILAPYNELLPHWTLLPIYIKVCSPIHLNEPPRKLIPLENKNFLTFPYQGNPIPSENENFLTSPFFSVFQILDSKFLFVKQLWRY